MYVLFSWPHCFSVGTLPPGLGLQTSIINNAHSIPLSLIQFTAAEAAIFFSSIEVWRPVCSFGCSKGLLHNFFLIKNMIGPWGNFLNTIYRMLLIDMVSLEPWGEWCGDTLLHVANKVLIVELIDNCNQTYFQHIFWEFAIWMMQESVYSETFNVAIVDVSWFYIKVFIIRWLTNWQKLMFFNLRFQILFCFFWMPLIHWIPSVTNVYPVYLHKAYQHHSLGFR